MTESRRGIPIATLIFRDADLRKSKFVLDHDDTKGTKTVLGRPQTVRRVMRRLLEHEFEHYGQIKEISDALGQDPRA